MISLDVRCNRAPTRAAQPGDARSICRACAVCGAKRERLFFDARIRRDLCRRHSIPARNAE